MLISDDEKEALVRRLGAVETGLGEVKRRVDVNEERVSKVEERQNEQEGVLQQVKESMQTVNALIRDKENAWLLIKTLAIGCFVMGWFILIWILTG
jgi:predicted  nucleic acid-binding Zn-ribbon protein